MKRAMGIETEYGAFFQGQAGKILRYNPAADLLEYFAHRRSNEFRYLLPFNSEDHKFWLGSNGAKLYLDGEHVEYSSPECADARAVALYDQVGNVILSAAAASYGKSQWLRSRLSDPRPLRVVVTKNNSDFVRRTADPGKDVRFYGTHENYSFPEKYVVLSSRGHSNRDLAFFRAAFLPFLASRVILHGAGGMYYTKSRGWHYVISQRAFVIEQSYANGSRTTSERPLLQVRRDILAEPSDSCRLHLICGDSNMSPWSTYLKFGSTHLVLRALTELSHIEFPDLQNPVAALHRFSADPDPFLGSKSELSVEADTCEDSSISALDIQQHYLDLVHRLKTISPEEKAARDYWVSVVMRMKEDPMQLSQELDWVIKWNALRSSMQRNRFTIKNRKARLFDVMYSDISEQGAFRRLAAHGHVKEFFSDEEIQKAIVAPPETRARLRSFYLSSRHKAEHGIGEDIWQLKSPFNWHVFEHEDLYFADALSVDAEKIRQHFKKI